ncbi:MAG: hypothetical protein Q8N90_02285 [bacterium]|nr:hypothetical protein [bacterium]
MLRNNIKNNYPRVSIVNCVSEAIEMLRFSSEQLIENAGTDNFDYIIVCWNTTPSVDEYIAKLNNKYIKTRPKMKVFRIDHKEIPSIGYVPNLRAMINEGFNKAFELNQYGGLVNTDQAFYENWLINLVKHCNPEKAISSVVATPKAIGSHHQIDFGITEYGKFNINGFSEFCKRIIKSGKLISESELKGQQNIEYLSFLGLPCLFPREMWLKAGPWELTISSGTPDVNFFKRAHKNGFEFTRSCDSITYHLEGGERGKAGRSAPSFSKNMEYEPIPFFAKLRIKSKIRFYRLLKKLGIIKKESII